MKVIMSNTSMFDDLIPPADIIKRAVRPGAEVRNVRLSHDLPDAVIRAINRLLLEHKVIFFCDQRHLDDGDQERFAIRLADLAPDPKVNATSSSVLKQNPACSDGRANQWHKDVIYEGYPKISLLRRMMIPPYGSNTVWSDMAAAYVTFRYHFACSPINSGRFTTTPMATP